MISGLASVAGRPENQFSRCCISRSSFWAFALWMPSEIFAPFSCRRVCSATRLTCSSSRALRCLNLLRTFCFGNKLIHHHNQLVNLTEEFIHKIGRVRLRSG